MLVGFFPLHCKDMHYFVVNVYMLWTFEEVCILILQPMFPSFALQHTLCNGSLGITFVYYVYHNLYKIYRAAKVFQSNLFMFLRSYWIFCILYFAQYIYIYIYIALVMLSLTNFCSRNTFEVFELKPLTLMKCIYANPY